MSRGFYNYDTRGASQASQIINLERMIEERDTTIEELHRQQQTLLTALKDVLGSLVAAHSLLERGGKRAAASDTMFSIMLDDYQQSIERGRLAIKTISQNSPT